MSRIRAIVALDHAVGRASLEEAIPEDEGFQVVGYVEGEAPTRGFVRERRADVVLVACAAHSAGVAGTVAAAADAVPELPVVVLQLGAVGNGFMDEVFAAGADDIIVLPETPERLRHALRKAIARKRGAALAQGGAPGRLVCILGPKGGTGKTVTACNLAVALAERGLRTTLVDLDLRFGDVGLGLRLAPERTIHDLARSGGTLDADKLEAYLASHSSGLRALLAPTRPDQAGVISTAFIAEVLALLRSMSDMVVVDTSAGFPPEVITAIDSSTDVCAVGMLDAFSLKDTKLGLETLDRMGYDRSSVRLALNRADTHVGISAEDVRAILGRPPDVLIPSQRDIPRSVTEGIPIVTSQARSPAAKAFRALADLYAATPALSPVDDAGADTRSRPRIALFRRR